MEGSHQIPETEFTAAKVEQAVVQMYSASGPDPLLNSFLSQAQSAHPGWGFSWELIHPSKQSLIQNSFVMEGSHQIPETEFTAAKVEQAVVQMYSASGPDPLLNSFLSQAQSAHAAWGFSWELIHPSKPVEVQFFGANCLHTKVTQDWHELEACQYDQMRELLKARTLTAAASTKYLASKLHQVVATVAIQQRAVSKEAPNPVQYVFSFYTTEEKDSAQTCDVYLSMLDILMQLPKEYGSMTMPRQTKSEIHSELQKAVPQVVGWLNGLLDLKSPAVAERCGVRVFQCFGGWLELRLKPEDLMPLTQRAFLALQSPPMMEVAADVLVDVLGSLSLQRHPRTLRQLLEMVNGLRDMTLTALAVGDMDAVRTLCRMMVAAGESDPLELINMLVRGGQERKTAVLLLENIMTVAFPPGRFLLEETVSTMSLFFWMTLQDNLMDWDTSTADNWEEVAELLRRVYRSLMVTLLTKVQYPEENCWQQWGSEEHDEFEEYRDQIRETMTCCFGILQEGVLQHLYEALRSLVEKSRQELPVQWQEVEAIFTALGSMGQAADLPDCPYLSDIMRLLPSVHFPNPMLLSTALFLIGTYCEWLGDHGDILQAVFPLVLQGLHFSESVSPAVETLHHLVTSTLQGVAPFAPHILAVAQEMLGSDRAGQEECLRLVECVGSILSEQPDQDAYRFLNALLGPRLSLLQQLLTREPADRLEGQVVFEVKLLCGLFSCLNKTRHREEGEGEGMEITHRPDMVSEILQTMFPTLTNLVHRWKSRPAVVEAVSGLFVQSLAVLGVEFEPMAESVADLTLSMYTTTPHESVLHLVKELVIRFQLDPRLSTPVFQLLKGVCSKTIQSFDKIMEDPDIIQTFNVFITTLVRQHRGSLLSSGSNLGDLLKVAVDSMGVQMACVVKSGSYLLTGFLSASTEDERFRAAIHDNMPFIVSSTMEVICSKAGPCVLELMSDLLQACCKYQLQCFSAALRTCLSQAHPSLKVTDQDKDFFLNLFLRNQRDRIVCRELVMEFARKCHGVNQPGQGRQLSSS